MKEELGRALKQASTLDKILTVGVMAASASVLVMGVLQVMEIWPSAIMYYEPLIGLIMLAQTKLSWRRNRKLALLYLLAAVFILAIAVFIWYMTIKGE